MNGGSRKLRIAAGNLGARASFGNCDNLGASRACNARVRYVAARRSRAALTGIACPGRGVYESLLGELGGQPVIADESLAVKLSVRVFVRSRCMYLRCNCRSSFYSGRWNALSDQGCIAALRSPFSLAALACSFHR